MRIITIGSSPSSNICIPNNHVSAVHADLLLLDNGDIILTDKGSLNGTYLFGNKLEPNVDVNVTRGDKIEFAGCPLNWSSVPMIEIPDPSKVKGIYGVGKKPENRYCLTGSSVSRYHATIKEMKNGKWYIQDHSTNGTLINGQRIPSNQDIQIRRGDKIVCGGVPLQNPIKGITIPWTGLSVACAIVACVVFAIYKIQPTVDPDKATVLLVSGANVNGFVAGEQKYYFVKTGDEEITICLEQETDECVGIPIMVTGTAFFVSKDGLLVTNRHLTEPWSKKYMTPSEMADVLGRSYSYTLSYKAAYLLQTRNGLSEINSFYDIYNVVSEFIVGGTYLGVQYPNRRYSSFSEHDLAYIELESEEADVSLIRLDNQSTPSSADVFNIDKSVLDSKKLNMREQYLSVGYPAGFRLSKQYDKQTSTHSFFHLAQKPSYEELTFQGDVTVGGMSGSSICDSKGRLVGVVAKRDLLGKDQTYAVPIHYVVDMINKIKDQNK